MCIRVKVLLNVPLILFFFFQICIISIKSCEGRLPPLPKRRVSFSRACWRWPRPSERLFAVKPAAKSAADEAALPAKVLNKPPTPTPITTTTMTTLKKTAYIPFHRFDFFSLLCASCILFFYRLLLFPARKKITTVSVQNDTDNKVTNIQDIKKFLKSICLNLL